MTAEEKRPLLCELILDEAYGFTSYNDLSRFDKHGPIDHEAGFTDGEAHINAIEGAGATPGG